MRAKPPRIALGIAAGFAVAASVLFAAAEPPKGGYAPDPPVTATKKQWVFDVTATSGVVTIEKAKSITLEKAVETPRQLGRFAIELYVGRELLDRVRFNVPLMGDEPSEKSPKNPFPRPGFEKVTTRFKVQMAENPRAGMLLLVDRQNGDEKKFVWPPESDGHLEPWKTSLGPGVWPPPGSPPKGDAGTRDAAPSDAGSSDASAPDAAPAGDGGAR